MCVSVRSLISDTIMLANVASAQLLSHDKDKTSLQSTKARLKSQDERLAQLQWEHEVLVQRFAQVCV